MNRKSVLLRCLAVALWVLALSACGNSAVRSGIAGGQSLPPPDTADAAIADADSVDYRVGAQDVLDITVFGVPDLSRTVRVNATGDISLPLIGAVTASGHTIPELEHEIGEKLKKTYLQNPQVSVFVKEFASQRITLEGSLAKPGIYPITGKTSLLQAVALAGGLDPLAQLNGVVLFREIKGKKMAAVFDMQKISIGQDEDPLVYGGDIIVVEQSGSKNALQNFIKAAPAIGLFLLL